MTWRRVVAVLPGVGVSLLPKLTCPMCWPAYAGLLSAVGLGFLISSQYLLGLFARPLGLFPVFLQDVAIALSVGPDGR